MHHRRPNPDASRSRHRLLARGEVRLLLITLILTGICSVQLTRFTGQIWCPGPSTVYADSLHQLKPLFEKSGIEWAPPVARFSLLPSVPARRFTASRQEFRLTLSLDEQMYDRPPPLS